jgi:hypothetical protein
MATAMVSGAESQTDDALATLTYKAQVVAISPLAPDAPVKVIIDGKLTITGSLSANTASSYSAQAGAMFSVAPSTPIVPDQLGPYDPSISCEAPFSLSPCGSAKVPVPIHTSGYVSLGGIINVDLTAEAQVGNSSPSGNANAFAEVDPSIFIDPSFPNADMYTIITSPGIGSAAGSSPGTPVPEPGSLAILVTAIFAIARVSLLRRARWITEAVAI